MPMHELHEAVSHLAAGAEAQGTGWRNASGWALAGIVGRHGPLQIRLWIGAGVWLVAWVSLWLSIGHTDVLNQTMIAVVASALSALWLPPRWAMLSSLISGAAFNFVFVPPLGAFALALDQHHVFLLFTVVGLSWLIAWLMSYQRQLAVDERIYALRAEQLQGMGELLRDAEDPRTCAAALQRSLSVLVMQPVSLWVAPLAGDPQDQGSWLGEMDEPIRRQLLMAAGSGSHQQGQKQGEGNEPAEADDALAWYLPMRGRAQIFGSVRLPLRGGGRTLALRSHAQALCDQLGLALERHATWRQAALAEKDAHAHQLRNTLLTAISHDYRTPLATILSAATSLADQADRLDEVQRRRLLGTIVDEANQLNRITHNTLQLARLDSPGLHLNLDWESAEELVGAVLRRARQRHPQQRILARVDEAIPLIRCDAVLLAQMMDNLVDNAFTHGRSDQAVEVVAAREGEFLLLAVRDRGQGVPLAWRDRVFDMFERVDQAGDATLLAEPGVRRGAGLGLAVCRTIARVHGGELTIGAREGGGASLECRLPLGVAPAPFAVSGWGSE
jgi:two-component system, OmpR family, sensor histidine kinase KdpD